MQFLIKTLVDITNTNVRKRSGKESLQQDNNDMIVQTIGLRVNLENIKLTSSKETVDEIFGTDFKGEHQVWNFVFTPSMKDSISIDNLMKDFDSIPVNIDLDETAQIKKNCFVTNNSQHTNILFKAIE
jgi:hypothetical protein